MNKINVIALSTLLSLGASAALGESMSLTHFTPRFMPVLVQVNAMGKVTNVSPSVELTPQLDRLLRRNLDELISGPATYKGKAIASQFVINLTLNATAQEQGNYAAQFAYLSSSPVPNGSWYWVHVDGHRLALAERGSFNRNTVSDRPGSRGIQPRYVDHSTRAVMPPMRTATQAAPAANAPAATTQR